jgi:fructan beta-fructosidase
MRCRVRRLAGSAAALLIVSACFVLASATPANAGSVADYPEFPFPATNYDEPYRGQFHFSARGGWLNDPNGLLYYRGTYHLFYQSDPHSLDGSGAKQWGHATSADMVHWTEKRIALEPGVHPGDLWSGHGVVDANNVSGLKTGTDDPILVFSGTNGVDIFYSTDGAKTFQTYGHGRKVVVPNGTSRDPKVFWDSGSQRWVMLVWSDSPSNGGDFYTSTDLLNWTYRSRYAADWFFECPDMFPLAVDGNAGNTKWVVTSASGQYVIGSFDGTTFHPDWATPQRMDMGANNPGGTFYAAETFTGVPDGRRIQMAWQPGNHGTIWTGDMTFPAELALKTFPEGIRITRDPIAEIASLRGDGASFANQTITTSTASNPLASTSADTYEITAAFDATGATANSFGLRLHTRSDGSYDRAVTYDRGNQTLYGSPLSPVDGRITMRVLVDRGQLEIFGNDGKLSISDNVNFNSAAGSQGIQVFATGGSVNLVSLQYYPLEQSWGVGESTLDSNLAGGWNAVGGMWTDVTDGKQAQAGGDAFYLNGTTGTDFTYEGDVRVVNGVAAALTFRASADGTQHYTANVDTTGLVKLWRPGRDIATYPTPITAGRTYHLKVVASGSRIQVYLDHGRTPVIDATDTTYTSGRFGVNVFNGTAVFNNVNLNATGFVTNLAGPWQPVNGLWTVPGDGAHVKTSGDAFYVSGTSGTNFSYEADLTVVNGAAAALTFRANADASQHYTANVDTAGLVKLWRPGRDIATYPTPIIEGRTYHLKVVAEGSNISVYLGGAQVINVTDATYSSGYLGLNGFTGSAAFQNVTYAPVSGARPIIGLANKCVDVRGANPADGTPVQLYGCNQTSAQQWTQVGATVQDYGKCLDISNNGTANGQRVILWPCTGGGNQEWQFRGDGTLYNPRSKRCLDVPYADSTDGNQLQVWDCHAGANQQWRLG